MFERKVKITVELSEDTKAVLTRLDGDLQALRAMVGDLVVAHTHVIEMVKGEIMDNVAVAYEVPAGTPNVQVFEEAVQVFEEAAEKFERTAETVGIPATGINGSVPPPPGMSNQAEWDEDRSMGPDDPNRVRTSPWSRTPRHVQVEWLKKVLADGRWYAPVVVAREVSNDERHFRYLKGAVSGRFREMYEEGLLLRRDSHIKGSMYEYRLRETVEQEG